MTRPRRRQNREICRLAEMGVDADTLTFPFGNSKYRGSACAKRWKR